MQNNNFNTSEFLKEVISKYKTGLAIEHAYRPALEKYFKGITGLEIVNDPKRSENGAPDFVFLNKKIVVAYGEAKDINVALSETEKSEQLERYYGYSNLILTNCLEFRFYRNGNSYVEPIKIGELKNKEIILHENNFNLLEDTLNQFINSSKEPIKSGVILSKVMAGKARRIRDNVFRFLEDPNVKKNENLLDIYNVIKKQLLPEIDHKKFADLYAQTLVYGLFVARYNDTTSENFTRQEARDLVPQTNPFLRHFFDHIAGPSFDPRIELIVNELCEEFTHADVKAIVHNYYNLENNKDRDPIIHFYEDFLQEYDPEERKSLGVFYTPIPVVKYIVKKVDEILKTEFGLTKGLADSTKIDTKIDVQGKTVKVPVHRVQVLDPATGTGTFLNEIILFLRESLSGQEGRWPSYVKQDLLPRLHGFELMMASYTIANLKLSTTF
jgi:type I restriction-modification system DNA methylase subunit